MLARRAIGVLAFLFLAVTPGAWAASGRVTGIVAFRERIALPPGYEVQVSLRDVSRQDAPSEQIASQTLWPKRQPPVSYVLRFDPSRIVASHDYAVSARILVDGRLVFITDRRYPVITRGAPHEADLLLRKVGGPPR